MGLYDHRTFLQFDKRKDPTYRRRILHLLPRHVFTPTHDADSRDLNWKPRSALVMLLTQMKSQIPKQTAVVAGSITFE
jgi:hypothetical protein